MTASRVLRRDILALALLAAVVFAAISLVTYNPADPVASTLGPLARFYRADVLEYPPATKVTNACGKWGALTADLLLTGLGVGAYFTVLSGGVLTGAMLLRRTIDMPVLRLIGWVLSLVGITSIASLTLTSWSPGPMTGAGGNLGALGAGLLQHHFALFGSLILAGSFVIGGLLLCSDYLIVTLLQLMLGRFYRRTDRPVELATAAAKKSDRVNGRAKSRASTPAAKPAAIGIHSGDADDELDESSSDGDDAESDMDADDEPDVLPIRIRAKSNAKQTGRGKPDAAASAAAADETPAPKLAVTAPPSKRRGGRQAASDITTADAAHTAATPAADAGAEGANPTATEAGAPGGPHFKIKKLSERSAARAEVIAELQQADEEGDANDYELPTVELLIEGEDMNWDVQEKEVRRKAKILERTFADFGFKVRVVEIETGPVIAQYEVELEAGLRLSKITSLADDLAIALRVPSVRIVAPIPGKNTVGIEVPNEQRQVVRLREVIEETNGKIKKMRIPLFLGKDVSGNPLTVDLSTLPHLLIAGRTGTGKSVCLNAIISSILMTRRPDEVRLIMIDPKMVELSGYGRLPHLMHPVVTDMRKAEAILAWAVEKMEERYSLLARAGVRHISNYNQLGEAELMERLQPEDDDARAAVPRQLPFIVIVADEIADMMMTAGKEVEQHIIRLAQKSRAVGIHLILATQKPTVDVITGLIKSNLPARISFQVASRTDSRVVLDEMGADKLLGNGDMLFLWPGTSTLLRGQGTYLGDDEINRIVEFCSQGRPQNFVSELVNIKVQDSEEGNTLAQLKKRDELYESAVDIVVREGRGSVSLLQRALGIGYGRAARLIDFMAEDGIVGQYNGSQAREVVLSVEDWERMQGHDDGGGGGSGGGRSGSVNGGGGRANGGGAASIAPSSTFSTPSPALLEPGAKKRSNRIVPEPAQTLRASSASHSSRRLVEDDDVDVDADVDADEDDLRDDVRDELDDENDIARDATKYDDRELFGEREYDAREYGDRDDDEVDADDGEVDDGDADDHEIDERAAVDDNVVNAVDEEASTDDDDGDDDDGDDDDGDDDDGDDGRTEDSELPFDVLPRGEKVGKRARRSTVRQSVVTFTSGRSAKSTPVASRRNVISLVRPDDDEQDSMDDDADESGAARDQSLNEEAAESRHPAGRTAEVPAANRRGAADKRTSDGRGEDE